MRRILLTVIPALLGLGAIAQARTPVVNRYDEAARPVVAAKGDLFVGGHAAFSSHRNTDFSFAVIDGINSVGYNISAAPEVCWLLKDNLGVGARLSYGRSMLNVASGSAAFGDVSLGVKDYYTIGQNVGLTAFLRYYIPIGDSHRIAFYADAGLTGKLTRSKQTDEHTGPVVGTWQKGNRIGLTVNPGLTVLLNDRTALFASIGIAGISYGRTDQIHNQVAEGTMEWFALDYILNLAALNIGIDFKIGK